MDLRLTENEAVLVRAIVANRANDLMVAAQNIEETRASRTRAATHLTTVLELLIALDEQEAVNE